jgi:hypothetical protein
LGGYRCFSAVSQTAHSLLADVCIDKPKPDDRSFLMNKRFGGNRARDLIQIDRQIHA